jgi:hypothetical protein
MPNIQSGNLRALSTLLRVYAIFTLFIFSVLLAGFAIQTPLLSDDPKGPLNWVIWNGVRCGTAPCYVPPMLFMIHVVWGVFFISAARNPSAYLSFLNFTMWAFLAHGLLMIGEAFTDLTNQWHRFLMDIPYELILPGGIYWWRPKNSREVA